MAVAVIAQFEIEFAKVDREQGIAIGFANVSIGKDGQLIDDLQGDIVPPEELEKAAYDYVLHSREGDDMHEGPAVGTIVESMVFTPEKLKALGLPEDAIPTRWWIGMKLDPKAAKLVKSGERRMFSIAGEADRVEVE